MSGPVPSIARVRTRGAFASHEGPSLVEDDQRVGYLEDAGATFALVVQGHGASRSGAGRAVADTVADTFIRSFHQRTSATIDELTETWWRAEHAERTHVRAFASLPPADRAELRERIRQLLVDRRPDAMGDQAVLDAEGTSLLAVPALAIRSAGEAIELARQLRDLDRGDTASAMCALFAGGRVGIAHIGDCRAVRLRGAELTTLTRAHTLHNVYAESMPDITPEQLALLPQNVLVRVLGADGDAEMHKVDVTIEALAPGDHYLLMSRGLADSFADDELREALHRHGLEAAERLVERGRADFEGHTRDNVAAVAIEILG